MTFTLIFLWYGGGTELFGGCAQVYFSLRRPYSSPCLKGTAGCLSFQLNLPCVTDALGAQQCLFLWGECVSVVEYLLSKYEAQALISPTLEKHKAIHLYVKNCCSLGFVDPASNI